MSLTELSLAGNNLPNPSPREVRPKKIQESLNFFFYSGGYRQRWELLIFSLFKLRESLFVH